MAEDSWSVKLVVTQNCSICGLLLQLSLVTILSGCEINNFAGRSAKSVCYNLVAMFDLFRLWLGAVLRAGFGRIAV